MNPTSDISATENMYFRSSFLPVFMRIRLFFAFLIGVALTACGQAAETGDPEIKYPKFAATFLTPAHPKAGTEATIVIKADIADGWYVYSNDFDPDLGPLLAELELNPSKSFELLGKMTPVGAHQEFDKEWNGTISKFTKHLEFRQKVKVLKDDPSIDGKFSYQTCASVCVQGKHKFKIAGTDGGSSAAKTLADTAKKDTSASTSKENTKADTGNTTHQEKKESLNKPMPIKDGTDGSLWALILISFGAGLTALLTPCVFPMIPMTVSYFTKISDSEGGRKRGILNGIIFGLSIILIYTIPGSIVAKVGGKDFANWLSTSWGPNIVFFSVFLIFGASFLGMFEITLPSSFVNRIDSKASRNSLGGIFFMAFALVLVSFSCTGPIVGSIFAQSIQGVAIRPIVSMLAFSSAVALPFTLFAVFPSWMNSLPKSGGWLNTVKVSLGFIELAAAFKFLSVPDLAYGWHLLDREVFLTIWIVIFALWGFYLLGKLKFSHDSDLPYIPVPRLFMAITIFSFVLYMIPGLWGAPLKFLSGYLPPMETQDFVLEGGEVVTTAPSSTNDFPSQVKYQNKLHLPHHLQGFFDYKEAVEYARKVNKPIFIDFTGHGCVNCRKMEATVWSNKEVLARLKTDYVVLALYVDDKTVLPKTEWYTSKIDDEEKKTMGSQNFDFQVSKFNGAAQPQYVLVNAEGDRLLNYDKYYDAEVSNFVKFLDEGSASYKKQQP
jgi:thiol:disulfide interchange protein DsbD